MDELLTATLVLILLLSAVAGMWLRHRIDPKHLSRDSVDSVRLLMGMLLTFAAIVLGLLTSNAKQRFDSLSDSLSTYSSGLIELDNVLRRYGADADSIRRDLRRYTALAIGDTWPGEQAPDGGGEALPKVRGSAPMESQPLGRMLGEIDDEVARLTPADLLHQHQAAQVRAQIGSVIAERWKIISLSGSTRSWPFLTILTIWLAIIFAIFGMTSPPGRVIYAATVLTALSIASPLYLILEYDDALTGGIVLSSASMRSALAHMDTP